MPYLNDIDYEYLLLNIQLDIRKLNAKTTIETGILMISRKVQFMVMIPKLCNDTIKTL